MTTTSDGYGMDPAAATRPALVVAGMHRSGTSAMARVLSLAGGALPDRVIQPGPDNPLGFWEPWEMVALSDEILGEVGSAWDDVFAHRADARAWARRDDFLNRAEAFIAQNYADRPLPVIKDPRSSVLTRLWRQALRNRGLAPVYVIMVRHPLEVAGSLAARDGFPIEKGLLLWAAYMLAVERDTREQPRVFVSYPALLDDWRGVLDRVEGVLGAPLPGRAGAAAEIDAFLSRSHRHHEADARDPAEAGGPVVGAVHDWMRAAAADQAPDPSAMDAAGEAMERLTTTFSPVLEDRRARSEEALAVMARALADREARLVREHGRVEEAIRAEVECREALTAQAQAAEAEAEAARADVLALRALRLETTALKTTIGQLLDDAERERTEQARLLDEATARVEVLQARNDALKASVSWKLTRPLRAVQKRLKGRPR